MRHMQSVRAPNTYDTASFKRIGQLRARRVDRVGEAVDAEAVAVVTLVHLRCNLTCDLRCDLRCKM